MRNNTAKSYQPDQSMVDAWRQTLERNKYRFASPDDLSNIAAAYNNARDADVGYRAASAALEVARRGMVLVVPNQNSVGDGRGGSYSLPRASFFKPEDAKQHGPRITMVPAEVFWTLRKESLKNSKSRRHAKARQRTRTPQTALSRPAPRTGKTERDGGRAASEKKRKARAARDRANAHGGSTSKTADDGGKKRKKK